MTSKTFLKFKGGPLDGTSRRKTVVARAPIYLTKNGMETIHVRTGHYILYAAQMGRATNIAHTSCYVRSEEQHKEALHVITYRYITTEEN